MWRERSCLLLGLVLAGTVRANPAAAQEAEPQGPKVEKIDVVGNQYLQRQTLLYYVSTKAGDLYDEHRLKEDFHRLWETGFLDDLSLEVLDGQEGKIVSFRIAERKRIQVVDYRGSKALSQSNIEDELKKRDAQLRIDTFYDLAKARKVEAIIRSMLQEKGLAFGTVKHDVKPVGGAGVQVSFTIVDGPKAKVKTIEFDGNHAFTDKQLRASMKKIKPEGFWNLSWIGGKSTYNESKWLGSKEDPGDSSRVQDFYLNRGYVTATVGTPRVIYADDEPSGSSKDKGKDKKASSKKKESSKKQGKHKNKDEDQDKTKDKKSKVKWVTLVIPVSEGEQYRVGDVSFEGLTVFKPDAVRTLFKLHTGDIYDDSKLKKGYEKLRDYYGSQGYFQWTGSTKRKPDAARKVVDVTLAMEEDKRYYVGHINFLGNERTHDKVIRRELYLNEGDVFNTEALKASIKRVNQLGYFKPVEGGPDLQPNEKQNDMIDVSIKVEEQNRNQFTFGGGFSGLDGAFVNAGFQTANFLGLGETVSLNAQTGRYSRNFQFAITEPYFMDRPITAGVDVYLRRITYQSYQTVIGYSEQTQGFTLTSGFPAGKLAHAYANYSYAIVDLYGIDQNALKQVQTLSAAAGATAPIINTTLLQQNVGRRYESSITPSWVRNSVDNPFLPRNGTRVTASFQWMGGLLGGSTNFYRPTVEGVAYKPFGRKMALGLRGQVAYSFPFASTTTIPYYQRFFLGGETQIRGYNVRTVSPIDPKTHTAIGGNKFMLFNAEYYFDLFGPVRFLLFYDAGEAYPEGQGFYWKTMRTSTGAELRFVMPVLNVPFRLIYAWNANRDYFQPATAFKFAVGTTF